MQPPEKGTGLPPPFLLEFRVPTITYNVLGRIGPYWAVLGRIGPYCAVLGRIGYLTGWLAVKYPKKRAGAVKLD